MIEGPQRLMGMIRVLSLIILWSAQVKACLNVEGTTMDGDRRTIEGHSYSELLRASLAVTPGKRLDDMLQSRKWKDPDRVTTKEIDGVKAVFEGRPDEAIGIFKEIEADDPGRYNTAANLGTAYELHGDLELALQWIKEGIRRNPDSHLGTEWLHVEILKARIKLKDDPGFLDKKRIITLPETFSRETNVEIGGHGYSVEMIRDALFYQLRERMVFVKPPDAVVSDLLFTFAVLEAHTEVVEQGMELLELAKTFGFRDGTLLERTVDEFEGIIRYGKFKRWIYAVIGLVAFVGLLMFASRRKWFFMTKRALRQHQEGGRV